MEFFIQEIWSPYISVTSRDRLQVLVNTVKGLKITPNVNNFLSMRGPSRFCCLKSPYSNLTLGRYVFGILAVLPYPLFP